MRVGLIADLHLGHAGHARCWHNRLLFDRADTVTRAAVAALNARALDAVLVLGDLTQSGTDDQLAGARAVLDGLAAPWYVLPGNHDGPAVRRGAFDAAFAGHLLPGDTRWDGVAVAAFGDLPPAAGAPEYYVPDPAAVTRLLARLEAERPRTLLVASHVPLLSGAARAAHFGGKDAGHYAGGAEIVAALAMRTDRLLLCCGHQHFHHVQRTAGAVQLTTAALIEYPMEARLLTLEGDRLAYDVLPVASEIAAASLKTAPWVAGHREDRSGMIDLSLTDANR